LLGRSFGGENLNKDFHRSATVSELRRFYVEVAFIIVILDLKIQTIRFNIVSQQGSLFEIKEKIQKERTNYALRSVFQSSFQRTPF
jgi:hypothetical protein